MIILEYKQNLNIIIQIASKELSCNSNFSLNQMPKKMISNIYDKIYINFIQHSSKSSKRKNIENSGIAS